MCNTRLGRAHLRCAKKRKTLAKPGFFVKRFAD